MRLVGLVVAGPNPSELASWETVYSRQWPPAGCGALLKPNSQWVGLAISPPWIAELKCPGKAEKRRVSHTL